MEQKLQSFFHLLDTKIVGQESVKELILVAYLSSGHVLLEGAPGLGKTLLAKSIAEIIGKQFSRVQFTPDLLPSDITGSRIYDDKSKSFSLSRGPIFTDILLADEINRAPSKVQSALLEAMQEKQVTIAGESFSLPNDFFVIATQNPLEHEGTYPLPEAQLDRFLMKILIDYPSPQEELQMLQQEYFQKVDSIFSPCDLENIRNEISQVEVSQGIYEYVVSLVSFTRNNMKEDILYGASPRASLALISCAKTYAFLQGRDFVLPEDIKFLAPSILRHRIILSYEALASGKTPDMLIEKLLYSVALS